MNTPTICPINIIRGDDYNLPILVVTEDADGVETPVDVTGGHFYFTVKDKNVISDNDNDDSDVLFQIYVTETIPLTSDLSLTTVSAYIPLTSTNTNKLKSSKTAKYLYDIQYTDGSNNITTVVIPSPINVILDGTRSE